MENYQETQHQFNVFDSLKIYYRHWLQKNSIDVTNKPTIVLLHRGHEHSGRVSHLVKELNLDGYQFFAWDARGHGQSEGERGDAEYFSTLVRDFDCFMKHLNQAHSVNYDNVVIIAQSVGAVIAASWVHDYAIQIRALVLASPAFKIKLYVPLARQGLAVLKKYKGNFFVNSYIKPFLLTHDRARVDSYKNDPLITRQISAQVLLDLYETSERLIDDASTIYTPVQLIVSGSDFVVHQTPQKKFFERLGSSIKEYHVLPHFYHDTLGEKDRFIALEKIKRFIESCFSHPICKKELLDADKIGLLKAESEALALPDSSLLKRIYWRGIKLCLKTVGTMSDGIKLGFKEGFDSGHSLDYVYCNSPSGGSKIGRWIDKQYLNSIGWRGIRQRKVHLEELLLQAVNQQLKLQKPITILDVAAGQGRYIFDALSKLNTLPDEVLLRDYSEFNVEQGNKVIKDKNLPAQIRFEKGDAFNPDEFKELSITPTISIVSGLYELFGNNFIVQNSLNAISQSMQLGGLLIYTGQPWHPQLEFIARVLTSHKDGNAWVMRRRTQLEMDQLVESAGFEKLDMRIDPWGIFTVSLARKVR